MSFTEKFFKIFDKEKNSWYTSGSGRTSWSTLSGAKTVISSNKLDKRSYIIYQFIAEGKPYELDTKAD